MSEELVQKILDAVDGYHNLLEKTPECKDNLKRLLGESVEALIKEAMGDDKDESKAPLALWVSESGGVVCSCADEGVKVEPVYEVLRHNDCQIISKDDDSFLVACNRYGAVRVERVRLEGDE